MTAPDKYAVYFIPAYAVTALVFAWMILDTLLRARRWRRRAEQLEKDPEAVNRVIALAPAASFLVLIIVFAGYLLTHHSPQVVPRATVGQAAPAEVLPTLEGGAPTAIRPAGSGPMLVNFYASWCPPCAAEAPMLAALKAHGVTIVGVAWKDDPAKTRDFLARFGDPYAARFVDRDGRAGIDFGITAAPETYVIGADGKIIDKIAAPLTPADAETLAAELKR